MDPDLHDDVMRFSAKFQSMRGGFRYLDLMVNYETLSSWLTSHMSLLYPFLSILCISIADE